MAEFLQPIPVDEGGEPVFDPNGAIAASQAEEIADDEAKARDALKKGEHRRLDVLAEVQREREEVVLSEGLPESARMAHDKLLLGMRTRDQYVKLEPPKPLVQGLLNMDSLSWIAGPSGSLKSFIAADLAFRYASGDMAYHNRKMTHGRVLFVVAEGGSAFQGRILAWEKEHKREVCNVEFYPQPLQLADIDRDVAALVHYMATERDAERPFGLVIFDTQSLCTSGVDENSNDMTRVINVLHRLRRVNGACIMPIHHTGKDGTKGLRGSSTIHAAADTVIMAMRAKPKKSDGSDAEDDDDTPAPLTVTLSTSQENKGKQKDLVEEDKALTLDMEVHEVGTDWFGDPITSLVPLTHAARLADQSQPPLPDVTEGRKKFLHAMEAFKGNHSVTTTDLGKKVGENRNYARDALIKLEESGLVRSSKAGNTVHWQVTHLGLRKIEQLGQQVVIWAPESARQQDRKGLSGELSDSPSDSP